MTHRGPEFFSLRHETAPRIALLRALKLGDLMCAVPAVRAIKQAAPHSSITLIGLPWAREFAERFSHLVDSFIEFPGWPSLPEREWSPGEVVEFLRVLGAARFDLIVQMHGSGSHVNDIVALSGARRIAGFYKEGEWCPDTGTFIPYPNEQPEIWRLLHLAAHLGARPAGEHLEFPIRREDLIDLSDLVRELGLRSAFAIVHPGALSNRERMWELGNFIEVGKALASRGLQVVLTGTKEDEHIARTIRAGIGADHAVMACGKTSLGTLGALVARATLMVSHDTGVSHIAAALKTPSVIIFDRSDREGWPPADRQLHRFVCRFGGVQVSDVMGHADDLLRRTPTARRDSTAERLWLTTVTASAAVAAT